MELIVGLLVWFGGGALIWYACHAIGAPMLVTRLLLTLVGGAGGGLVGIALHEMTRGRR
jgi:hypothetical protein